jgi:hypothetical protein
MGYVSKKNFLKIFLLNTVYFPNFANPWTLGCQGWVVIPQNVKKSKSLHPTLYPPHTVELQLYRMYNIIPHTWIGGRVQHCSKKPLNPKEGDF